MTVPVAGATTGTAEGDAEAEGGPGLGLTDGRGEALPGSHAAAGMTTPVMSAHTQNRERDNLLETVNVSVVSGSWYDHAPQLC